MADSPDQPRSRPDFGPTDQRLVQKAAARASRYDEIGRTGLRHWGGFVYEEWLRDLQPGRKAAEVYREMSDQDPVVGGIMYAVETMVRKVDWWVEPASDAKPDQDAAAFYEQVLFEDTEHSWNDLVSEILSMLIYGYSYFEIVWKQRAGDVKDPTRRSKFTDGKIGVRKFAIRAQDSLWKWEFDDDTGDLLAMTQQAPPSYELFTIPVEKALHFRTKVFKENPEGRSLLRNAYRSYWTIKGLEALEGIGCERDLAGLPVLKPPPGVDIWNANDPAMVAMLETAKAVVTSIRRDEQEGIILPDGWTLELLGSGGKRQFDVNTVIGRHQHRMAAAMLADLLLLGQDKVGSYALSATKEDIFNGSIDSHLDSAASVFDSQFAPRLFKLNAFPGITDFPKLQHGNVQGVDLAAISDSIQKLGMSGMPLWPNQEAEDQIMDLLGLPKRPDDTDEMLAGGAPPKDKPTPETPADGAAEPDTGQ